jgi:hypothetical protein
MEVVKMRVLALARKVQTDEQFRKRPAKLGANQSEPVGNAGEANSRPADVTMEDSMPPSSPSVAEGVSADIRQYRPVNDILNGWPQQIGLDFQSRRCEKQNTQKACSQNADDEHQGYSARSQEPPRPNEKLQEQFDMRPAGTASESPPRENAQGETDVLRQTIRELEGEKATLLAEVERLEREICALKAANEKLKADICVRPNVGLAAELQDILNLISDCDVDGQLLDMGDATAPAEAGDLIHLAGHKRGSGEEGGGSSHGTVKRLKQGDVV